MRITNSKSFASYALIPRLRLAIQQDFANIQEAKVIKTPQEDLNIIRDNIFNLLSKLERSISMRIDQEIIEPYAIASLTKLTESYMKLIEVDFVISEGKTVEEKPRNLSEEDQTVIDFFKKEIMAPRAGFEPATKRLTAACSTTELPRNKK